MQLRLATQDTGSEYVAREGWREARLLECPLHRGRRCGLARHGTYTRKTPPGTQITRYYCRKGHTTFSLLPDCLSARLPGELREVEEAVRTVERASSLEAATEETRLDIELPGALRWLRRRARPVHTALLALVTLLPGRLGHTPRLHALGERLKTEQVLVRLRHIAARHLRTLPKPLGLRPPLGPGGLPGGRPGGPPTEDGADGAG